MGTDGNERANRPRGRGGAIATSANPFSRPGKVRKVAELGKVDSAAEVIDELLRSGFAIIFGQTRDGGAVSITLLDGETKHRTYCANQEELNDAMLALEGLAQAHPNGGGKIAKLGDGSNKSGT